MKQLFPIIICIAILGAALYFVFDTHEKRIRKNEVKDSVFTAKVDKKIAEQDSIQRKLLLHDSIQSISETKQEKRFEKTKNNLDAVRDSLGFLPDL